jgi:hypothetical protein
VALFKNFLAVSLLSFLLGACGSNFEWFPKGAQTAAPVIKSATVKKELPFPKAKFENTSTMVKWASDLVYDSATKSFWLLAGTTGADGPGSAPNALVQMSAETGSHMQTLLASTDWVWPFTIVSGSTLAYDGSSFWITSHGNLSGTVDSNVYQLFANPSGTMANYFGAASNFFACPATSTGFCQGLAWDGANFWSAASDSSRVVSYQVDQSVTPTKTSVISKYESLWSSNGITDVSFDKATSSVFVISDGIIWVRAGSSAAFQSSNLSVPVGTARGDWDGQYLWVVDNATKSIKALFVR